MRQLKVDLLRMFLSCGAIHYIWHNFELGLQWRVGVGATSISAEGFQLF